MSKARGTFACLLALAVLLLPLPTFHYGLGESLHIDAVSLHGDQAHTCDCEHSDRDVPARVSNEHQTKQPVWITGTAPLALVALQPVRGFTPLPAQPAPGFAPIHRSDIRGPPRSTLALFCTLRV
ncbi:MAG: hypothetical protein H6839_14390 [Planctomycetes bacterium]|nr:hypothetical protein [Planctomycetota bacterium]